MSPTGSTQGSTQGEILEGWSLTDAEGYLGPQSPVAGVYGEPRTIPGAAEPTQTALGFSDADLGRHILFLGGIGTGKTVGMQSLVASMRQAARPDDVFVFFDTKGDFHNAFYREGDATICVGNQSAFAGSQLWNLFAELRDLPKDELTDEVNEIAATLFESVAASAGDNNRFWSNMGQELFAGLLLTMARWERRSEESYSNLDLRAIADTWDLDRIRRVLAKFEDLRGTQQYIARDDSNTTNSVLIFLQQMLRQTFSSTFAQRGDFSVRRFIRSKGARALFLEYDVAHGATLTPIFRTLVDLVLKESLSRNRAPGRVFVILDEFALLPQLRHIDGGLNFGRSLGLRFVVGTQNTGQILDAYGPGLGNSILSAFGTVFSFRLFDHASRDYVRDRFGTNRRLIRYDAAVRSRGIGEQLVDGSVVEDWDLTGLQVGHCIAALPDRPPVRFHFKNPH